MIESFGVYETFRDSWLRSSECMRVLDGDNKSFGGLRLRVLECMRVSDRDNKRFGSV